MKPNVYGYFVNIISIYNRIKFQSILSKTIWNTQYISLKYKIYDRNTYHHLDEIFLNKDNIDKNP